MNPLINLVAPVTGFMPAVLVTTPLAFAILYGIHRWNTVVSEVLALMLPFVVLGNVLTLVGLGPHRAAVGMTLGIPIGHFLIVLYRDWATSRSFKDWFVGGPEPLFWQPS